MHTKGPWTAEKKSTAVGYAWHIRPISACLYVDERGGVCNPNMKAEEAEANARLIAAAPEMLAALIWIKDELVQFHGNVHGDCLDKGRLTCPTWEAIYKVREAIAKAERGTK